MRPQKRLRDSARHSLKKQLQNLARSHQPKDPSIASIHIPRAGDSMPIRHHQDSSALILRFSDPLKPQFRMVNRSRCSVAFRQEGATHQISGFFGHQKDGD